MTVKLVDLDAVMPQDRVARINGVDHLYPGSPPMEWYLWQQQFLARALEDDYQLTTQDFEELQAKVFELLRVRNPNLEPLAAITPGHLYAFLLRVYAADDDGDVAVPPPVGTATSPRAGRTRSRS